jgi:hypothetical protein
MATTRIATVKATGRRYVVERIAFARKPWEADKVFCWGDVESYFRKGGAARAVHEKDGKSFARADVDIAEVEVTDALYRGLLAQSAEVRREAGHVVEQRGRNYVDRGTPEQAEASRAAAEDIRAALAGDPYLGRLAALARRRA